MPQASTFLNPLRYDRAGHFLDQAPLELIDALSFHSRVHGYASDFLTWEGPVAVSASPGTGGWIFSGVNAGAGAAACDVLDSQRFGRLRLITDAADNDDAILQLNGSPFRYVVGDRLWFAIRIAPQTANDGELFFGLAIEGLTAVPGTLPTNGLFFTKSETATAMDFHARAASASTQLTALDPVAMADDVMHEYGFAVDATGNVRVYIDAAQVGIIAAGNDNLPTTEDLSLYMGVMTGSATTRYMDIDHVLVAQERN